jgi:hypothetical protein
MIILNGKYSLKDRFQTFHFTFVGCHFLLKEVLPGIHLQIE